MKAPTCRICGQSHWTAQPCKINSLPWALSATTAEEPSRPKGCGATDVQQKESDGRSLPPSPTPKKKRAPAGTFDRLTYQRDLMRKRRAELKRQKDQTP